MPIVKRIPGYGELELYYIGEIARYVGKNPQTLRKWERAGVIPRPLFRTASKPHGIRLYTREQMVGMKFLIQKWVKRGRKIPFAFSEEVRKLYQEEERRVYGSKT